ncbi:unnamed protein product [Zymoseptoria tritici ST99CH_3D7]|uniref:DUF7907 domain-containing protein n=2 Tax=Zymoseptoria tritici TaxID=1047171 RepID=A0A1X7S841_ZYMT9|nr:unnamed protein product [Zymoseptoria tritici ST99CH_3D7]SMR60984.1 unnamed protein product [Zymoseptoria tritici ST99CH_1E4]
MKSTIAGTAAALLALSSSLAAQTTQSAPFRLAISGSAKAVDGKVLSACHEGAAIEGLCISDPAGSTFQFNTTTGQSEPNVGTITYKLDAGTVQPSYGLTFLYSPSSTLAHAQFGGIGQEQQFGFDKDNKLYVPTYYDESVYPPKSLGSSKPEYHWYLCNYNYAGYGYQSLNWAVGDAKPKNPTCAKVDVVRRYSAAY